MNEVSLKPVIEELENLFSKFNARFFADKLEKPVITVSPDHTRGAYGWCTGWKAWKAGEDEGHYEINLCAEYLNRPFEETCGTLIHEMVHLQNLQDGVQDTSRSGTYHNKKFKRNFVPVRTPPAKEYWKFWRERAISINTATLQEFELDSDFWGSNESYERELIGDTSLTRRLYARQLCGL